VAAWRGAVQAILHAPDYVFLDEATASLDEPSEEQLYGLLRERLPDVTISSIGYWSTLEAFHDRLWSCIPGTGITISGKPSRKAADGVETGLSTACLLREHSVSRLALQQF